MYRIARRVAFGIGACLLVLVSMPHRAALADELPQNACGIRAPFSIFRDMIEQSLQPVIDEAADRAGVSMTVTGIQIIPQLGRLGYQTVADGVRPNRLPAGSSNDPNTSDDDFIEIVVSVSAAGGLSTFDIHVAIAFPQNRPDMVDPVDGTTCVCRRLTQTTRYLINVVEPCDPPEEDPNYESINCHEPFWTDRAGVLTGEQFDFLSYSYEGWDGAGWSKYLDDEGYPHLVEDITDANGDPVTCDRVESVMCSALEPEERVFNGIPVGPVTNTYACIMCVDDIWSEDPVWIDPDAFPNLLAVEVWYSGAGPIATFYLDEALKEQGFKHPHIPDQPFERACCLQRELGQTNNVDQDEPIDQIARITGTREIPGFGSVDMGQLIRDSGGVRLSEAKAAVILMIPSVNVYPGSDDFIRPDGERACTHTHTYPPLTNWYLENLATQITTLQLFDAPKVLDFFLRNLSSTRDFATQGMKVTCNHAEACPPGVTDYDGDGLCDCWELGISDIDGDGFCDDVDICMNTVSGSNCDSDGDGFGDAPRGMLQNCLNPPGAPTPLVGYGQTLEASRQFYCGGCDNCPGAYNPRTHIGNYLAIHPDPNRWPWLAATLVDENGHVVVPLPPAVSLPSRQEDRDGDGIGDACDEDADDDGIHVEHDCDDLNEYANADLDGDGLCDSLNRSLCRGACNTSNIRYWPFDLSRCRQMCDRQDNCVDGLGAVCADSVGCASTEAAESHLTCAAAGNCTFFEGPNWPDSSLGNRCVPAESWCADVFANQDQSDVDGDDLGDKCDWLNVGIPTFDSKKGFHLNTSHEGDHAVMRETFLTGKDAQIAFRARGGQPTVVGNQLQYNPEPRTHTQIGACWCEWHLPDGTWHPDCLNNGLRCPNFRDRRWGESHTAWSPINSPQCANMQYHGDLIYEQDYNTYGICFAREFEFSRDEATNYHELSWSWNQTRSFPDPSVVIGGEYDESLGTNSPRSTTIRVAWPDGDTINYDDDYRRETAESNNKRLDVSSLESLITFVPPGDISPLPPYFAVAPAGPFDPIAPVARAGYLITENQYGARPTLLALSKGTPEVSRSFVASFSEDIDFSGEIAGAAGAVDRALVGGTAGTAAGVFVFQGPASPAKLFIGYEAEDSTSIELLSTEYLWETAAPEAYEVKLLFVPGSQELLLFGSLVPGGPRDNIWRLRLAEGVWEGPVAPPSLRGLHGYSVTYDPIRRRALLFGGAVESSDRPPTSGDLGEVTFTPTATIRALDLRSLVVTIMAPAGAVPSDLARYRHGAGLDVAGRALYVQGGERSGAVVDDAWRFDLRTRQWVSLGGAGPAALEPLVHYDHDRRALWVGDFTGAYLQNGLDLWGRDGSGSWYRTRALSVASATVWPVTDVYRQGSLTQHLWSSDVGAAQPGQHWLAQLDPASDVLGLSVRGLSDERSIMSEPDGSGLRSVGFLCPAGQRCAIEVGPLPGSGSHDLVSYQLDVIEAVPVLESSTSPVGSIRDLLLWSNGQIVVAGPAKLKVLDRKSLAQVGELKGQEIASVTAVAACGTNLCVSRNRLQGLAIVDIGDGSAPRVVAQQFTSGLAKDIAVQGRTAYLAQGVLGVGVYDVGSPAAPLQVELFQPFSGLSSLWREVVSVAVLGNRLLAVAGKHGIIHLYDLAAGRAHVGTISVPGSTTIKRIRFKGRHLWVLSGGAGEVTVYDVDAPTAPRFLGSFSQQARELFRAVFAGVRRFTYGASLLSVHRLEPLTP